jgi:hypothetical protein
VGSAVGSIRDLFAKIKAIDAKHGKFDLVLCTGDFFGPLGDPGAEEQTSQLLQGEIEGARLFESVSGHIRAAVSSSDRMLHHARRQSSVRLCNPEIRENWR